MSSRRKVSGGNKKACVSALDFFARPWKNNFNLPRYHPRYAVSFKTGNPQHDECDEGGTPQGPWANMMTTPPITLEERTRQQDYPTSENKVDVVWVLSMIVFEGNELLVVGKLRIFAALTSVE